VGGDLLRRASFLAGGASALATHPRGEPPLPNPLHPLWLQASSGAQSCADPSMFVPMALFAVVIYFMLIRPQQKQDAQKKLLIGSLKKGDSVVTQSGLFGRIYSVGDKEVQLEIGAGQSMMRVRWLKSQIAGLEKMSEAPEGGESKSEPKPESKKVS
jgi:preprotein translocase subunit YajC